MKDVRLAVKNVLAANAAVLALSAGRIFPGRVPQGELRDSVVYTRISEQADYNMNEDSGLINSRYQIDCYSLSQQLANDLSNACYDALTGFKGIVEYGTNSPRDTIEVTGIFLTTGRDLFEEGSNLFRVSRDYFVWYRAR